MTKIALSQGFLKGKKYFLCFKMHQLRAIIFIARTSLYPHLIFLDLQEYLTGIHPNGRLLALPPNIRLGWKLLMVKNILNQYATEIIMAIKKFIVQAPGVNNINNLFSSSLTVLANKLECLNLSKFLAQSDIVSKEVLLKRKAQYS